MLTFPVSAFAGFGSGFDEETWTKSCTVVPTSTTVTAWCAALWIVVSTCEGRCSNSTVAGAVAWLFERKGVVLVDRDSTDEDELTLAAAEGGADDVTLDGSSFQVLSAPELLPAVREAVEAAGFTVENSELTMLPKTTVEVADESDAKKVLRLMDQLEDNDDVQDVYANFDIPERVLEAVAG